MLHSTASERINWARLLKWVFDIDIEQCPHFGGKLKIVAAISGYGAITRILDRYFGFPAREPPRSSAQNHDLFEPT